MRTVVSVCVGLVAVVFAIGYTFRPYATDFDVTAFPDPLLSQVSHDSEVHEFVIDVSDKAIELIHKTIRESRIHRSPEGLPPQFGEPWANGVNYRFLHTFVRYWVKAHDWRVAEARLNALPNYRTSFFGHNLHFIHITKPDALGTVLLLHGWPGSVMEFLNFVEEPAMAQYNLVIPSLPGYGWSEAPKLAGFDHVAMAQVMVKLMDRLGYDQYYVQGGDWGSMVGSTIAQLDEEHVLGLHINFVAILPPWPLALLSGIHPSLVLSESDAAKADLPVPNLLAKLYDVTGYMHEQSTRPDTIGYVLADNPASFAAWILPAFHDWGDVTDHQITERFSLQFLADNMMTYVATNSVISAIRLYQETLTGERSWSSMLSRVNVPTGIADFPREAMRTPEKYAKWKFPNLISYTEMPRGGHFAAVEEPTLLAEDLHQFIQRATQRKAASS